VKLHRSEAIGKNAITGYGEGYVMINQARHPARHRPEAAVPAG